MIRQRLKLWLGGLGLISAGSAVAAAPAPQPPPAHMPAAQAPASWIAYATQLNAQLQARLADESAEAAVVHADMQAMLPASDPQADVALAVKVWVDPTGALSRVEATPVAAAPTLNADLAGLFKGQRLPTAPPAGMLLPIRLELKLTPAPPPAQAVS